jgi:hypothetical protein
MDLHPKDKSVIAEYLSDVVMGAAFLGMLTYTIMAIIAVVVVNCFGIQATMIVADNTARHVAEISAIISGIFTCRILGKWLWLSATTT